MENKSVRVYVTDKQSGKRYYSENEIIDFNPAVPEQINTEARKIRDKHNLKREDCEVGYE
jgi:hypothetical protein